MNDRNWAIASYLFTIAISIFILIFGPSSEIFGIVKPITLFQYAVFVAFAMTVNLYLSKIAKYKNQLLVLGFLFILASGYEVLWNFFFWFSNYGFYGINTDIDSITYNDLRHKFVMPFNISLNITEYEYFKSKPVNLNVNSKLSFLIFFCSLYFVYKLSEVKH
jgi:hypothetical protein